jgi:glycosyltransferase involved in cell wall biosynthesis
VKVSIIIPVFNSEKTIENTINSCLKQTYSNIEILVIDDGSTDKSAKIIKSLNNDKIKYFYFENSGRSEARNRGLKYATGEYIQFLDSDDSLEENKIEIAMEIFVTNSEIDAIQCGTRYWKDNLIVSEKSAKYFKNPERVLLRKNIFPIHSVVFKKKLAAKFPKGLSYCEDWYFWVKTFRNVKIVFQQKYFGANVFIHENNTMTNHEKMLAGEFSILLAIKKEIETRSLLRDLKIYKQYINYLIKYGFHNLNKNVNIDKKTIPLIWIINLFLISPKINRTIKKVLLYKNKLFKKEQLY